MFGQSVGHVGSVGRETSGGKSLDEIANLPKAAIVIDRADRKFEERTYGGNMRRVGGTSRGDAVNQALAP